MAPKKYPKRRRDEDVERGAAPFPSLPTAGALDPAAPPGEGPLLREVGDCAICWMSSRILYRIGGLKDGAGVQSLCMRCVAETLSWLQHEEPAAASAALTATGVFHSSADAYIPVGSGGSMFLAPQSLAVVTNWSALQGMVEEQRNCIRHLILIGGAGQYHGRSNEASVAPQLLLLPSRLLSLGLYEISTDDALKQLTAPSTLQHLNIMSTTLTDAELGRLASLPHLLEVCVLDCPAVTGAGVAKLCRSLPQLQHWSSGAFPDGSAAQLSSLLPWEELRELTIQFSGLSDVDLSQMFVGSLPKLQHFGFSGVTDPSVGIVMNVGILPNLTSLDFSCARISNAGLKLIGASLHCCQRLQHLNLSYGARITDVGIAHLITLRQLQRLDLRGCPRVTDVGLGHLASLREHLQQLTIQGCARVTDAGLGFIAQLRQLRCLRVMHCSNISDGGLAHIAALNRLAHLDLCGCSKLTDAGMAHVALLVNLRGLNIAQCSKITDAGVGHLVVLQQLQHLNISRCGKVTDSGVAHVGMLSQLLRLEMLLCVKVTDVGLACLSKLQYLQLVNMFGCAHVTVAGREHLVASINNHLVVKYV
jgi:hypothetical protein